MTTKAQRALRRDQREATRREILSAAEDLLRVRPYRELSVEGVMAGTGLTRTAFYRHFDDVRGLVLRLLEEVGVELYAIARQWRESSADLPAAARVGLAAIVDFFVRNGPLVRAMAEAASTDEEIERGYRNFVGVFEELIRDGLDELADRGLTDVPDSRALARALNLMNEAYLLHEFGREPVGDRDLVLATLETVWLRVTAPQASISRARPGQPPMDLHRDAGPPSETMGDRSASSPSAGRGRNWRAPGS